MLYFSPFLVVQGTHLVGYVSYKDPALDDDQGVLLACHNTPLVINLVVHESDRFPRERLIGWEKAERVRSPRILERSRFTVVRHVNLCTDVSISIHFVLTVKGKVAPAQHSK